VTAAEAPACGVCRLEGPPRIAPELVAAESRLWIVRHHGHPAPLEGWVQLVSRRCVQGPARFNDEEAEDYGDALREVASAVETTTSALRVYCIAFGEGAPHLHVHIVPRFESLPETAAWKVADWYRAVERGERRAADPAAVTRFVARLGAALCRTGSGRWRLPADR
jgi:diadenosine tetraphosphate (Ap4A) HIT family hydrolase